MLIGMHWKDCMVGMIMKAKKVAKVGIQKEAGYLYFVDSDGDISKVKANRKGRKKGSRNK